MRKICAITANRADFSRMETVLHAIQQRDDLELSLIVMGSHLLEKTGHTVQEIKQKGFRIDYTVQMELAGSTPVAMAKSVGLAMVELATIINHLKPDIVLAPVDRFESLAMGITPALMNIHVAHIQGGEVTGTIDESIRHALTKMSHLHFVATEESRQRVIKMGEPESAVFNVGCPATDLLLRAPVWDRRNTLQRLNQMVTVGPRLNEDRPYLLMMQHPVTTEYSSATQQIEATLAALNDRPEQTIILWPNIDAGSEDIVRTIRHFVAASDRFFVFTHMSSEIFTNVLRNAVCQVGNSSSGIREACYFGTPVVNVGSRQRGRERGGNVVDVECDREAIARAIEEQVTRQRYPIQYVYGDGTAGRQTAEILATCTLPPLQKRITY